MPGFENLLREAYESQPTNCEPAPARSATRVPRRNGLSLRGRDCYAIGGDDLRLVSEDFAAAGVHDYLHPIHIVGAVGLVISEGFHASEVFQAASLGVEERLVNAEVMGVTVDIGHRPFKGDHFVAQGEKE